MKNLRAKFLIASIACGIVSIASLAFFAEKRPNAAESSTSAPDPDVVESQKPSEAPVSVASDAPQMPKGPEKDQVIEDFTAQSFSEQIQALSPLTSSSDLPDERKRLLKRLLHDRRLHASVRNGIANILANQADRDKSLWRSFAEMANDASQLYQWREYCVQHLADSLRYSHETGEITQVLWRCIESGEKGIPGTALLLVCRLNSEGVISVPDTLPDLLGKLIRGSSHDISVRMTALSVVGERREVRCRSDVLSVVEDQPALRRVALATLGLLGDERDRVIVAGYAQDQDTLVAAAARGALERLSVAQPDPSSQTSQSFRPIEDEP